MGRNKASRQRHKAKQRAISNGRVKPEDAMAEALALPKGARGWMPRNEKIANMKMPSHTPAKSFADRLDQGFSRWG